jgi:hypothetical protein
MKIGPNAPALDGLCIWMMQISSMYIGHEEDFNFILISFCLINYKKQNKNNKYISFVDI